MKVHCVRPFVGAEDGMSQDVQDSTKAGYLGTETVGAVGAIGASQGARWLETEAPVTLGWELESLESHSYSIVTIDRA